MAPFVAVSGLEMLGVSLLEAEGIRSTPYVLGMQAVLLWLTKVVV